MMRNLYSQQYEVKPFQYKEETSKRFWDIQFKSDTDIRMLVKQRTQITERKLNGQLMSLKAGGKTEISMFI